MKFRPKVFLILLAFSLTPLVVVTIINHVFAIRGGEKIHDTIRSGLTEIVSQEMFQTAKDYGLIMSRTRKALEFAVLDLAKETERALAESDPPPAEAILADEFDDPKTMPRDVRVARSYQYWDATGRQHPQPVSFNQPVFHLAPGIQYQAVEADIRRLNRLTPSFQMIVHEFEDIVHWVYVSLQSGVHASFPGHGGYPEGYDPRARPWYKNALAEPRLAWSLPMIDATSGQVIYTISKTVHWPDGSMAGVAALDVPLTAVLHSQSLVSQWSNQMRVFLVRIAHSPETGEEALLVWARKTYQSAALAWDQPVDVEWIDSNHSPRMNEFIEAMKTNYAGVMALPFDGRDSIGAYARIEGPDYFVLVVPKSVFMSMPDQTSRLVLDYLRVSNWTALTGLAVAVLFVAVFAYIASKRMVQPLMILVHAAQRLARGDFTVRLDISARDERDLVYQSFNEMVPMLEERLSMSRALEVAQEVQKNLLPQQAPAAEGLDVAGASIYCERTGGDYFDYFHKPGNGSSLLAVLVGDVSGHGVSSALLMATARALLRLRASLPGQSADIIGDVNRLICQDTTHTGQFMTLFYAEFSPERDAVRWVRAGHEPALVYDPETNAFSELRGPGIAFGLDESFVFHENEAPLRPGRIILIGTDGIWETHNPEGRMFGKDALKAVIRQNADASSEAIIQAVYEALADFRRQRPIEDDVTLVVVKVLS